MIGKIKFTDRYGGKVELDYFNNPYNMTCENERAVEIALALNWLNSPRSDLIEIGCVMPHYGNYNHPVIDLYEENPPYPTQKINAEDGFYRGRPVLCISTIEHIKHDKNYITKTGYDEMAAPALLDRIYKESNSCFITWPAGVHPPLDKFLYERLNSYKVYLFQRISGANEWIQVYDKELILTTKYAEPFHAGNLLIVVEK